VTSWEIGLEGGLPRRCSERRDAIFVVLFTKTLCFCFAGSSGMLSCLCTTSATKFVCIHAPVSTLGAHVCSSGWHSQHIAPQKLYQRSLFSSIGALLSATARTRLRSTTGMAEHHGMIQATRYDLVSEACLPKESVPLPEEVKFACQVERPAMDTFVLPSL
jgi:hypothetical protein